MFPVQWNMMMKSGFILVLVILIGVWFFMYHESEYRENMNTYSPSMHNLEGKQEEINIPPTFYDASTGTLQSGPEYTPSPLLSPWYKAYTGNMQNHYLLDDGAGGSAGLQFNMCSKSCCKEQYPLPFKMPVDSAVCASKSEFVPSGYMCNNAWQDTGCVCLTKKQANFIGGRGGNA